MERLTKRDQKGRAYFDDDGSLIRGANGTFHQKKDMTGQFIHQRFVALDKAIDRLAAYEGTGLEPEEIAVLQRIEAGEYIARDKAVALIEERQKALCPRGRFSRNAVYGTDRETFDAWQEIIDAIENIQSVEVEPFPNIPLTLDELRKMDGEPVWVEFAYNHPSKWMLVNLSDDDVISPCDSADFECYGAAWLAYRRKPGEV